MSKLLNILKSNWLILLIAIIGISIRLVVMPISAHADFFSTYWRADQIVSENHFVIDNKELFSHYIHSINYGFWKTTGLVSDDFFYEDWGEEGTFGTTSYIDYFNVIYRDDSMLFIFLGKLPYLILEILSFILLLKIFSKNKLLVSLLFWFNFFGMYSGFIYGRYEIYPIFISFLLIFLQKKMKLKYALPLIMIIPFFRIFFSLLIPIWIIHNWKWIIHSKKRIMSVVLGLLLLITAYIIIGTYGFSQPFEATETLSDNFSNNPIAAIVSTNVGGNALFPMIYFLFLYLYNYLVNITSKKINFENWKIFTIGIFIAISLFFIINNFSLHYLAWPFYLLIPTLIILFKDTKALKVLSIYIFLQINMIVFSLLYKDNFVFAPGIFSPISSQLQFINSYDIVLSGLKKIINLDSEGFRSIFKSIFSTSIIITYIKFIIDIKLNPKNE